jgi:hypothetical protein
MALGYNKETHLYTVPCAGTCGGEARSSKKQLDQPHFCRKCSQRRSQNQKPRNRFTTYELAYRHLSRLAKQRPGTLLTFEEYTELLTLQPKCHYCGHSIIVSSSAYRLDRKNNSIGYTKENCVVCCGECNRIKSDRYSYEEMEKIGKILAPLPARPKPRTNNGKRFWTDNSGKRRRVGNLEYVILEAA